MRFVTIQSTYQKEITGVSSIYQLEIKKKSFEFVSDEKIFNDFFKNNTKDFSRNLLKTFISFPQEKLTGAITLFPTSKKLKRIDFFRICPNHMGIWVAVSKKVMDIFSKYQLPNFNKIKVKIDGFFDDYYIIGFPLIPIEDINYNISKFINRQNNKIITYKTFDNYKNRENQFDIFPKEIYLSEKYVYDVLNVAGVYEICVIPEIVKELNQAKCLGFHEVKMDQLVVKSD